MEETPQPQQKRFDTRQLTLPRWMARKIGMAPRKKAQSPESGHKAHDLGRNDPYLQQCY